MMYGDDNVEADEEDDRGDGEENEEEGKDVAPRRKRAL